MSDEIDEATGESDETFGLFSGDSGRFDFDTRVALVRLLRGPFLDGRKDAARWAAMRRSEPAVRRFLAELFLVLVVDDAEQIAFTQQATDADASAPTVLRQVALTMIDSALVLFLRQSLSATAGTGQRAIVGTDDIVAQLTPYRRDTSTDESVHRKRINGAVSKMLDAGILTTTPTPERFEVSPVLRILFPAEQIAALAASYARLREPTAETPGDDDSQLDLSSRIDAEVPSDEEEDG